MKRTALAILLKGFVLIAYSQTQKFQADLDKLYSILQNTPSFKDQIFGNKRKQFDSLYQAIRIDTISSNNPFESFIQFSKLFFLIRDNHLGFNQYPSSVLASDFQNAQAVKKYNESSFFKLYPRSQINLDSLRKELVKKPKDSVEGIYYYDNYLTIGLFRTKSVSELAGIVLETTLPNWDKGQIAIRLYEYLPNYFHAIYGHPVYKGLSLYNNEKFRNHSLINSYFYSSVSTSAYKKDTNETDYSKIPISDSQFLFKTLDNNVQIIRLGNFSAMNKDVRISDSFFNQIKDSLTAAHLVVDLRENTGGAEKVSRKFLELIKQYAKTGKVYVLVNNGTMSQGEIFTLQLKRIDNVKVYGQTTKGTISYGSNYGKREMLPSQQFDVYITDMRSSGNLLQYENFGVHPDVELGNDKDWIAYLIYTIRG